MTILRKIRKNKAINRFIRSLLIKSSKFSTSFLSFFINRWSPSGILNCNFGQYKFKYYNESDDGLPHYFFYNLPYHEKADLNLFIELSKRSDTIVDIGANTGLFSVLASVVNTKSKIYSIEPYNVNAERLKINLNLNSARNASVHEIAIGEIDGEIEITIPKNRSITDASSIHGDFSKGIYPDVSWDSTIVKVKKLDSFADENKLKINLIKCDVETFEMSVFKGAERILADDKPTIIFECFLDDERKSFFNNILTKYNYYVYLILDQGVVHISEGFVNTDGLNYLLTPVKPSRTFIGFKNVEELWKELLLHPTL